MNPPDLSIVITCMQSYVPTLSNFFTFFILFLVTLEANIKASLLLYSNSLTYAPSSFTSFISTYFYILLVCLYMYLQ